MCSAAVPARFAKAFTYSSFCALSSVRANVSRARLSAVVAAAGGGRREQSDLSSPRIKPVRPETSCAIFTISGAIAGQQEAAPVPPPPEILPGTDLYTFFTPMILTPYAIAYVQNKIRLDFYDTPIDRLYHRLPTGYPPRGELRYWTG